MKHALIVGDNFLMACAMEHRLRAAGFTSVDIARNDEDCFVSVQRRLPTLIAMLDANYAKVSIETVREISDLTAAPVLLATAPRATPHPIKGASLDGPFPLKDLDGALAAATHGTFAPMPLSA